jgi:hypothetical protein
MKHQPAIVNAVTFCNVIGSSVAKRVIGRRAGSQRRRNTPGEMPRRGRGVNGAVPV